MNTLLEEIQQTCGFTYKDLGYKTDEEFKKAIEIYIRAIQTWINTYTHQNYPLNEEKYPVDLSEIVREIVNKLLATDSFTRDLPILDNANYKAAEIITNILTSDLIARLQPYKARPKIHIIKTWGKKCKKRLN
jgi:hypothetical protein